MKQVKVLLLLLFGFSIALKANLPWDAIAAGNSYWADMLGVKSYEPKKTVVSDPSSPFFAKSDASFKLINAALRYKIDELSSSDLVRFSDSLKHVLIYLSGASPAKNDIYNRAGWWKLPYPVAIRYGLKVDKWIDERHDFEKSTRAAMAYAQDLQKRFPGKRWQMAFVQSPLEAVRENHLKNELELAKELALVNQLMLASNYSKAEEYAVMFFFGNIKSWKSNDQVLSDLILEKTGIPKHTFYALNPELSGKVIPAKTPVNLTKLALENLKKSEEDVVLLSSARIEEENKKLATTRTAIQNNTPDPTTTSTTVYKVKSGDNLGFIANRYGVRVSELKSWNNLRSDVIYAGQKLVVYSKKSSTDKSQTTAAASSPKKAEPVSFTDGEFVAYKVKNGDTLWSIAKQFPGVSPDNLMAWNGISSSIRVGQEIKVLKSEIRGYSAQAFPDKQ